MVYRVGLRYIVCNSNKISVLTFIVSIGLGLDSSVGSVFLKEKRLVKLEVFFFIHFFGCTMTLNMREVEFM